MKKYLFELHMHTEEVSPCGKVPAREGVRLYKRLGYSGICITDHFYAKYFDTLSGLTWAKKCDAWLRGYQEAWDEGEKLGLKVFLGMEYCIPGTSDDILVYGFDESFIYSHENLHLSSDETLKKLAKANDLLLIQAHPFRKKVSGTYDALVEGFEVFNGNPRHDSMNAAALEHGKGFNGIMLSGSDFHQPQDAGTGGVALPRIPGDSQDLVRLLREIKVLAPIKEGNG